MPQIICKGLKEKEVMAMSDSLSYELAEIMDTPRDWFIFEHIDRKCYVAGSKAEGDVMIDIWWFDRGQEIKDKTALAVDKAVRDMGYSQIEIAFNNYREESYYENGKHY